MDVTSVNKSYIYYSNGSRIKATEEALITSMHRATADKNFYYRMYKELALMFDVNHDNLKRFEADPKKYFEKAWENSGILDASNYAFEKYTQAEKIEHQAKFALGLEGGVI